MYKFEQKPLQRLVLSGVLAALTAMLTMVIAIPIPGMAHAYVNMGDVGVYLCAALLGPVWGALSAAVGSALADTLYGSFIYIVPTFLIKGLMALIAATLLRRMHKARYIALFIAGIVMPVGYLLFESALYGFAAALAGVPANLVQYAACAVLGVAAVRIGEQVAVRG